MEIDKVALNDASLQRDQKIKLSQLRDSINKCLGELWGQKSENSMEMERERPKQIEEQREDEEEQD